jgi:flagellar protein FliS
MNASGIQAYKKAQVGTADQGTLILMCYDGAITFIKKGKHAMLNKDPHSCNTHLGKAQNVLWELTNSLNLSAGQIAHNLEALYNYMIRRIIYAEYHNKPDALDEVITYLCELKESWEKIIRHR